MSQQTTLGVVLPYFLKFVQALPDCSSLARASEEELRGLWQGLGYYSRARNLQKGARYILDHWGDAFPEEYEDWLKVPGCGPYTASVVASICFKRPVACVDGNVVRVMSRLHMEKDDTWSVKYRNTLTHRLNAVIAQDRPGDFNQAMMELGATVCKPRNPMCSECPLKSTCKSFHGSCTDEYPPVKPRKSFVDVHLFALVMEDRSTGTVALFQRNSGFLSQTFGFPLFNCGAASVEDFLAGSPLKEKIEVRPRNFKHTITNHRIGVTVGQLEVSGSESEQVLSLQSLFSTFSVFSKSECQMLLSAEKRVHRREISRMLSSSLDQKIWLALNDRVL